MRYSEAILKLEKDPTLKFMLFETYKTWTLRTDYDPRFPRDESLYFMLECEGEDSMDGAGEFSGNLLINDDRWVLARQPVAWQEAIQAWADGKVVYVENKDSCRVYCNGGKGEKMYLLQSEITNGTWYVED